MNLTAGSAIVEIKSDIGGLIEGLSKAQKRLAKFGRDISSMGSDLLKYGTAGTVGLGAMAKLFASMGDQSAKAARRVGISVQAINELSYAASLAGADMSYVEKALDRMSKNLGDAQLGIQKPVRALQQLGIELSEIKKLKAEDQFVKIAEAIGKLNATNPNLANTLLKDLFGRSGTQLLPLFVSDMESARKEARALGLVMSNETAAKAEVLTDQFFKLTQVSTFLAITIGEKLSRAIFDDIQLMLKLASIARTAIDSAFFKELINDVYTFSKALMYGGGILVGFGSAIKLTATLMGFFLSPMSIIASLLIVAAGGALYFAEKLGYLNTNMIGFLSSLKVAGVTLQNWGQVLFTGITTGALMMWKALQKIFGYVLSGFADMMSKIFKMQAGGGKTIGDVFMESLLKVEWHVEKVKLGFASLFEFVTGGFKKIALAALDASESIIRAMEGKVFGIDAQQVKKTTDALQKARIAVIGMGSEKNEKNAEMVNTFNNSRGKVDDLANTKFAEWVVPDWMGGPIEGMMRDAKTGLSNSINAALESTDQNVWRTAEKLQDRLFNIKMPKSNFAGLFYKKDVEEYSHEISNLMDILGQAIGGADLGQLDFLSEMRKSAETNIKAIEEKLKSGDVGDPSEMIGKWKAFAEELKNIGGFGEDFEKAKKEIEALLDPKNQPNIDDSGSVKDYFEKIKAEIEKAKKEMGLDIDGGLFNKLVGSGKAELDKLGELGSNIGNGVGEEKAASFSTIGTFGNMSLGQMFGGGEDIARQQLEEQKKTNQKLSENIEAVKKIQTGASR